jgi:hypothetical protein
VTAVPLNNVTREHFDQWKTKEKWDDHVLGPPRTSWPGEGPTRPRRARKRLDDFVSCVSLVTHLLEVLYGRTTTIRDRHHYLGMVNRRCNGKRPSWGQISNRSLSPCFFLHFLSLAPTPEGSHATKRTMMSKVVEK